MRFSLVEISTRQTTTLDHTPICLDSKEKTSGFKQRCFFFEKWWLEHKEVHDLVKEN